MGSTTSDTTAGILDCFAGWGGFHRALTADGRHHLALAVEIDPDARRCYQDAFPDVPADRIVTDIRTLTRRHTGGGPWIDGEPERPATSDEIRADIAARTGGTPIDIICGGFPCQPFSKSGAQNGTSDTRSTIGMELIPLIDALRPRHVLLENVPNFGRGAHTPAWTALRDTLRRLGYRVPDQPLHARTCDLAPELGGTPQSRARVFIPATLAAAGADLVLPDPDLPGLMTSFGWDADQADVAAVLDDDDHIPDIATYRLDPVRVAYLNWWDGLLQTIGDTPLPGVLDLATFTRDWTAPPATTARRRPNSQAARTARTPTDGTDGADPADIPKLRASHAWYLANQTTIDRYLRTRPTLPKRTRGGAVADVPVADIDKSFRRLEWQARSLHDTAGERSLWRCLIAFRPSGIRVRPATYAWTLVQIATQNPIYGPRRRYLTPRETARLQGVPAGVWSPQTTAPIPLPSPTTPAAASTAAPVTVTRLDPDRFDVAVAAVVDRWWRHGGIHPAALDAAIDGADRSGATPGDVLVAAGAAAEHDPRFAGSGIRTTTLVTDTYEALAATGHPVAFDPVLAAVDWRVRWHRKVGVGVAARPDLTGPGAAAWVDAVWALEPVRPETGGFAGAAARIVSAGLDIAWLRALTRSAWLASADPHHRPATRVADLDTHLTDLGAAVFVPRDPNGWRRRVDAALAARGGLVLPVAPPADTRVAHVAATRRDAAARLADARRTLTEARRRIRTLTGAYGIDDPHAHDAVVAAARSMGEAALRLASTATDPAPLLEAARWCATAHLDALGAACAQMWARRVTDAPAPAVRHLTWTGAHPGVTAAEHAAAQAGDPAAVAAVLDAAVAGHNHTTVAAAVHAARYERVRTLLDTAARLGFDETTTDIWIAQTTWRAGWRAAVTELAVLADLLAGTDTCRPLATSCTGIPTGPTATLADDGLTVEPATVSPTVRYRRAGNAVTVGVVTFVQAVTDWMERSMPTPSPAPALEAGT